MAFDQRLDRRIDYTDFIQFQNYKIVYVILPRIGLSSSIPVILGNLVALQILDLSGNQITGSIPPQLGSLVNLNTIDLSGNRITGSIPAQLGLLVNLKAINLQGNQITGFIPPALAQLIAKNGGTVNLGPTQPKNTCLSIAQDPGYLAPQYQPLWIALAACSNDMNAFDVTAKNSGNFALDEYMFQAFRTYAAKRASCMAKHPEYVFASTTTGRR